MITQFNKSCPKCGKLQYYTNKYKLNVAIKHNWQCRTCKQVGKKPHLNCKHTEESKSKMRRANYGKKPHLNCKHTEDSRQEKQDYEMLGNMLKHLRLWWT